MKMKFREKEDPVLNVSIHLDDLAYERRELGSVVPESMVVQYLKASPKVIVLKIPCLPWEL